MSAATAQPSKRPRWVNEPLLHFLVLGLLLFVIDRIVHPPADDALVIVVDAAVEQMLVNHFLDLQGRVPDSTEHAEQIAQWARDEVLYREALALGLERDDELIREQLVARLRSLLYGVVRVDEPETGQLAAWLEAHRARYDRPLRLDFEAAALAEGGSAEQLLATARAEGQLPEALAQRQRLFLNRAAKDIAAIYDETVAAALVEQSEGAWLVLETGAGPHLFHLLRRREPEPATLASHREQIAADWREEQAHRAVQAQIDALRARYAVRREGRD